MTKCLDLNDLRPALRLPAARAFLLAYLAFMDGRVRRVAEFRERGPPRCHCSI